MRQLSIFLIFISLFVNGQKDNFLWPLDKPISLSGNYGELRPNHFHAGLDFSTNNKINAPVYAVQSGYVSRIKVSSVGYGKAVYITHPNGVVTLYGHLTNYVESLNEYVKVQQLKAQSYEIELMLKPNEIAFKAGDLIGYSGSSGSSTGPHLHFEIRDEKTEVPLNPALYYKLDDIVKPVITQIGLYNLGDTASAQFLNNYEVKNVNGKLKLKKDSITIANSIVGLAFSGFDKFTADGSQNNIYSVEVKFDGQLIYHHQLDNISFSDARYVNEFSDTEGKFVFQKCFLPNLYPGGLYKSATNKGRIFLLDTNYHVIQVRTVDENNNENILEFHLRTKKFNYYLPPTIKGDTYANCQQDLLYSNENIEIFIPAYTLYNSTPLIFENTLESTGKLIILPSDANMNSTAIVGFQIPKKHLGHKSKLVFKNVDNVYLPIVKNDSVFYSVKNFGWFNLAVDSVSPTIKTEIPAAKLQATKGLKQVTFILKEDLSGIKDYKLTINGNWALAEYDAKSGRLTYFYDVNTPKGDLNFVVETQDKCFNKATYSVKLKN